MFVNIKKFKVVEFLLNGGWNYIPSSVHTIYPTHHHLSITPLFVSTTITVYDHHPHTIPPTPVTLNCHNIKVLRKNKIVVHVSGSCVKLLVLIRQLDFMSNPFLLKDSAFSFLHNSKFSVVSKGILLLHLVKHILIMAMLSLHRCIGVLYVPGIHLIQWCFNLSRNL